MNNKITRKQWMLFGGLTILTILGSIGLAMFYSVTAGIIYGVAALLFIFFGGPFMIILFFDILFAMLGFFIFMG